MQLETPSRAALHGALAGVAGGVVFGLAMIDLGNLPTIASIVRVDSEVVGFVVHMAIAATVGAGFGLLVRRQRPDAGETLVWGLAYGALWWFVGALTLLPLFLGEPLSWTLAAAQAKFPSLLGHLFYGATTALALVALRRGLDIRPRRGPLVRGALAGLSVAALLGATLPATNALLASSNRLADATWPATLVLGLVMGLGYAALYPRLVGSAGATLVRGVVAGFVAWVVVPLTILPALDGDGLAWSVADARATFTALPSYVLLGAVTALLYHWLDRVVALLFADDVRRLGREGAGAQALRSMARGAAAGLVGGLLFTLVMLQVGFLPTVAGLVGSDSSTTGFFLHLVIADAIGATYGLLFRRQAYDLGSAMGWGAAYGFCWWILGWLTILPVLLGDSPTWDAATAASRFPALVGHLVYGAGLGVVYYLLEARTSPWWVSRSEAEAERLQRRRDEIFGSAPALWALVVVIALTVPLVVGGGSPPSLVTGY
jgi:uncharacterized membrane protein YagU involved in acid resistance